MRRVLKPLKKIPLEAGDRWAWWALIAVVGFSVGWVAATNYLLSQYVCFPPT